MIGRKNKLTIAIISLILVSLACGLGGNETNLNLPNDNSQNSESESSQEEVEEVPQLRCQELGYPCHASESDPAALDRAFELLDEAADMLAENDDIAATAAFLEGLDEVVEVAYETHLIFFRVENAAPMVVSHPDYDPIFSESLAQSAIPASVRPALPRPVDFNDGPVGPQEEGEDPKKHALIKSPYQWQFGVYDEGDDIAAILAKHRDYDCSDCITFSPVASNPFADGTAGQLQIGVSLDTFLGWQQYDLIHIATHGRQACNSNLSPGCITMLNTGGYRHVSTINNPDGVRYPNNPLLPGVIYGRSSSYPAGWYKEMVTSDFFRSQYPSGLSDTIIFFSACQVMKGDDLAQALAGPNTTVLGWSETVPSDSANEISIKFYEFLINDGLQAKVSHKKAKEFSGYARGFTEGGPDLIFSGADEPRGREVITLIHPIFRNPLKDGATVTTQGAAGDGENDDLFFSAIVDGLDEDQDPGDYEIHVSINGQEVGSTFKAEKKIGDYAYRTRTFAVPLPFDVVNEEKITLETWIDLPDGGQTRQLLENIFPVGCGWNGSAGGNLLSGKEVINTHDGTPITPEALAEMRAGGASDADLEELFSGGNLSGPLAIIMGSDSDSGFPMITAAFEGGSLSLSQSQVYGTQDAGLNIIIDEGDLLYGTVEGSFRGASGSLNYSGNFYWHQDSRCGFGVKLQAALNATQD